MMWSVENAWWPIGLIPIAITAIAAIWLIYRQGLPLIRFIRRTVYLLIALIGIAMLYFRPQTPISSSKKTAYISSESPNQEDHFDNVHDFLIGPRSIYDSIVIDPSRVCSGDIGLLQDYHISLVDRDSIAGIITLDLPQLILEKEPWTLSGQVSSQVNAVRASLINDQWQESQVKDGRFSITSNAPPAGTYLLNLQLISLQDTFHQQLSIEVQPNEPWQMLVITSFPTFEINALKNYWTSDGNGFSWRAKVSNDRYRTTHVNTKSVDLDRLTSSILKEYDFIVIDLPSYNALSNDERKLINRLVYNQGLGLLLLPTKANVSAQNISHPKIIDYTSAYNDLSNTSELGYYQLNKKWRSLSFRDVEIAQYQDYGLGRRMLLAVAETQQLLLKDQKALYNEIWKDILSTVYQRLDFQTKLVTESMVWSGEMNTLSLLTPAEGLDRIILNDSTEAKYIQHPILEGHYRLNLLPKAGYNSIAFGSETLQFYAQDPANWPIMRRLELQREIDLLDMPLISPDYSSSTPLSPWYGIVMMLFGLGALWLDERIY